MLGQILGAAVPLIGSLFSKKSAKSPDPVEPLDLQELARAMMVNTSSPWGGVNYSQDPSGQWSGEYKFSDEVQPIFDRGVERSLNPDQAYQMPPQLTQLNEALMNQSLKGNPKLPDRPAERPRGTMAEQYDQLMAAMQSAPKNY